MTPAMSQPFPSPTATATANRLSTVVESLPGGPPGDTDAAELQVQIAQLKKRREKLARSKRNRGKYTIRTLANALGTSDHQVKVWRNGGDVTKQVVDRWDEIVTRWEAHDRPDAEQSADHKAFVEWFTAEFEQHTGATYHWSGRDHKTVSGLVKQAGLDVCKGRAAEMFRRVNARAFGFDGSTIALLSRKFNDLAIRWEAANGHKARDPTVGWAKPASHKEFENPKPF